jgi:hypothetical protein
MSGVDWDGMSMFAGLKNVIIFTSEYLPKRNTQHAHNSHSSSLFVYKAHSKQVLNKVGLKCTQQIRSRGAFSASRP